MKLTSVPDLPTAQRALLGALVPEATARRLTWSQGETQVIEAGAGPPLLFVHGGFSQATEWMPLWPFLTHRYRLIAVDRPGHGLADPYDYRSVDTRNLAEQFMADILGRLELDQVLVVGNSMGGRWALELALRQPDRVVKLVLVGAPAGSKAQIPRILFALRWPGARALMKRAFRSSDAEGVRDFFGRILVTHPERLSKEFLVAIAAGQRRNYASILSFAKQVISYRSINPDLLMTGEWPRLQAPVHFIWGDADAFDAPSTGEVAVSQLPAESEITVIPGAGHLPWLDEPEAVACAIKEATRTVNLPGFSRDLVA